MTSITEKETLTDFEVNKLQRLAAFLIDENLKLQKELRELHCNQFRWFNEEECWMWQGDGSDNLHSLVCPVVIGSCTLQEIINRAAPISSSKSHNNGVYQPRIKVRPNNPPGDE